MIATIIIIMHATARLCVTTSPSTAHIIYPSIHVLKDIINFQSKITKKKSMEASHIQLAKTTTTIQKRSTHEEDELERVYHRERTAASRTLRL